MALKGSAKKGSSTVYDLDFWMKRDDRGLHVTQIMVHKVAGKPRYTWHAEKGVWKRKPAE